MLQVKHFLGRNFAPNERAETHTHRQTDKTDDADSAVMSHPLWAGTLHRVPTTQTHRWTLFKLVNKRGCSDLIHVVSCARPFFSCSFLFFSAYTLNQQNNSVYLCCTGWLLWLGVLVSGVPAASRSSKKFRSTSGCFSLNYHCRNQHYHCVIL